MDIIYLLIIAEFGVDHYNTTDPGLIILVRKNKMW